MRREFEAATARLVDLVPSTLPVIAPAPAPHMAPPSGRGAAPTPTTIHGDTTFHFERESIVVQAAPGESGDALLDKVIAAAEHRANASADGVNASIVSGLRRSA